MSAQRMYSNRKMNHFMLFMFINALAAKCEILRLSCKTFADFSVIQKDTRLLSTYQIVNDTDPEMCKALCIYEMQCKSLNVQEKEKICELNNKTAEDAKDNITTQHKNGWHYYSTFFNQTLVGQNCQQHKPCANGTKCYDTCSCPGYQCIQMQSCADWYEHGMNQNGNHTIFDNRTKPFTVYCDFTSGRNFAWTLVTSFSLENNNVYKGVPLFENLPRNESALNWVDYRLSKERIESLKSVSSHWRATCSFSNYGFDGRDYFIAAIVETNPLGTYSGSCQPVQEINVRGNAAKNVTVMLWHSGGTFLHLESSKKNANCGFKGNTTSDAKDDEDNFGFYGTTNPKFRCTENDSSTTQFWFGKIYVIADHSYTSAK